MTTPTQVTSRVKMIHDRWNTEWEVPSGASLTGYPSYILPTYDQAFEGGGGSTAAAAQRGMVARFNGSIFVMDGPILSYVNTLWEVDFSVKYGPTQISPYVIYATPTPIGTGSFPTNVAPTFTDATSTIPNYSVVGELVAGTQPRVYFGFTNIPRGSNTAYVSIFMDVYLVQAQQ